jgi:Kef-type K+ transport system membrane component KefB
MIIVFGSLMYLIAQKGITQHSSSQNMITHTETQSLFDDFSLFSHLSLEHIRSSIGILLLQILIILMVCRVVGLLFKKIGQPSVIGEIMAGIILGPFVLGRFFPQVSSFIFPEESFSNIQILSQFGLILFMFTIGMDLDLSVVKKRFQDTILISHASTIVPFFLGMLLAYFIYDTYARENVPFLSFALFIGISLSITAFPVLARILQERGLTKTHFGSISLASAANGDITAWCLLAAVMAYAQAGSMNSVIFTILFSLLYVAVMFFVIRPLLRIIGDLYHNKEIVDKSLVTLMFFILLASSYATEVLGLHVLFGAFVAGMVMPENMKFRKIMNEKVEDISLALFLPLFFVYMGLKTEIGLINGWETWLLCGAFILVAIVGKFGGTLIAARLSNENWKNSLYMGALMNTRGLMELVVLAIGLEMKILTPTVFAILVLMTLVTTFMTTPLISFISLCFRASERIKHSRQERLKTDTFRLLLSFGRASSGQVMLDLAYQMFSKRSEKLDVTALHLTVGQDINPRRTEDFEKYSFDPISYEANKLNLPIKKIYEVCDNAEQHICSVANEEGFDFLLVGAGLSMSNLSTDVSAHKTWKKMFRIFRRKKSGDFIFYPGSLIKDKTRWFIEKSHCSVGIFANRDFIRAENILVVLNSATDLVLLDYVEVLQRSTQGFVKLMNRVSPAATDSEVVANALSNYMQQAKETAIPFEKNLTADLLKEADLMLVSYSTWLILLEECEEVLQDIPSTFIIEHKEVNKTDREKTKKKNATMK